MQADLLLHNATIYTLDPIRPRADAVAIMDNRIVAVGDGSELRDLLTPGSQTLDLHGQTLLPAFTDCHIHFQSYALRLKQIDLTGLRSIEAILKCVATWVAKAPLKRWLVGGGWDRNLWPDPHFPEKADLDRVAPCHPVALSSKCGHVMWANSRALELAGISACTPSPGGGEIARNPVSGEPTGILKERAIQLVHRVIPESDPEEIKEAMVQAIPHLHRVGLTGIHDCEGTQAFSVFQQLAINDNLKLRVLMHIPIENLEAAIQLGLRSGLGDEVLRLGSVKIFADGSLGARTAAMLGVYEKEPVNKGIMVQSEEELKVVVGQTCEVGLAPAIHAIGDRATHAVLEAYQEHRPVWVERELRPRVEHAQLLTSEDIQRFGFLGIIASMQPVHCTADMEMVDLHWGTRGVGAYTFRSLLDVGTPLAFGSDCPVEDLSPLVGIHAAVTRRRADGFPGPQGWRSSERITVAEAVRAYTQGAAYASGEERLKGSISPGKLADLVVLSQDIFTIDPMDILETDVVATLFDGKVVYQADR